MGVPILATYVVHVVGTYHLQVELLGQLQEIGNNLHLQRNPVVLQFHEIILLAENIHELTHRRSGRLVILLQQKLGHPTLQASRKADQPLAVLGQPFHIRSRMVVKTIHVGIRNQQRQVFVTLVILGQHSQVIVSVLVAPGALYVLVVRHQVRLATDQGLYTVLLRLLQERYGAEQVPVVRKRHRRMSHLLRPLHQAIHPAAPVQQAEIGVHVQVNEIRILLSHCP